MVHKEIIKNRKKRKTGILQMCSNSKTSKNADILLCLVRCVFLPCRTALVSKQNYTKSRHAALLLDLMSPLGFVL